jgi:very-short-patch-repair endonuclease
MSQAAFQLEKIREKLLDLGLRGNSLLHFVPRGKKHIDIIDEKSSEIFKLLVQQEKKMSFLPSPEIFLDEDDSTEFIQLPKLQEYLIEEKGEARHTDLHLQTKLRPDDLDTRLLRIENEAKTIFQERGIDVLFLALGFLKWFEDKNSSKERFAPLLLVPIELNRTAAGKGFKLNYTGIDLTENETLYAKVKNDFGVELPRRVSDDQSDLDINSYFDNINQSVQVLDRFEVVSDKMALGFFSFGKFQMYKDLDSKVWPEGKEPGKKEILKLLFESGFERDTNSQNGYYDIELKAPEKLNLIKDADSTQTEAILKVVNGQNLVIQGPPGTGKSQTITNLIAEAISRDKKVLFVAQKLTALEVVKLRLDQSHIGQSVLELHSHKSRPRDVLDSLEQTLLEDSPQSPERHEEKERLNTIKNYLDGYANLLKGKVLKTSFSFGQAIGNFINLKSKLSEEVSLNDLDFDYYLRFDNKEWTEFKSTLDLAFEKLSEVDSLKNNPFYPSRIKEVNPKLVDEIELICIDLLKEIDSREQLIQRVNDSLVISFPGNKEEFTVFSNTLGFINRNKEHAIINPKSTILANATLLKELKELVEKYQRLNNKIISLFERESFELTDPLILTDIKKSIERYGDKWYGFLISDFRKAKKKYLSLLISKHTYKYDEALDNLSLLLDYLRTKRELESEDQNYRDVFHENWRGIKSQWPDILSALEFAVQLSHQKKEQSIHSNTWDLIEKSTGLVNTLKGLLIELENTSKSISIKSEKLNQIIQSDINVENDFSNQRNRLKSMGRSGRPLYYLGQLNIILDRFKEYKADGLIDVIYFFSGDYSMLKNYIEFSFWKVILNAFYSEQDLIKEFDRTVHERFIQEFITLDSYTFVFAQEYLVQYLHDNLPSPSSAGEMTMLRREMAKKRRLLPVRRLLENAGAVIQAIKPVFMMSPMSVATFLPPGKLNFDLVIFDEASQVPVPDSIGAMLRGNQIIVVGDSKQMPPSNFFSRSIEVSDEELEDDFTAEIESILDLFSAQGANQSMLKWHYRSKHESLIYTSNKEFYDSKLFVFPSSGAIGVAKGLSFQFTEGSFYDRSGSRTNPLEAKIIGQQVKNHIETHPQLSLGVVAFSMAQKDAIMFEVEFMRRKNPQLEFFFEDSHNEENFFVKNLENVQGDERDVIFISVGYGRTASGNLSKNFGPINQSGGERRLNVLMSRAKQEMIAFCIFRADELKVDANSPFGVRVLKNFLKYAETGIVDMPKETGKEADSIFEIEVAKRITELGYDVEYQVGSQGFFIDIAVRHPEKPGTYILAVECDGATYHSSTNARDRDRLRQSILESIGWKFHRIWSTDWFRDEKAEIQRLKERLENLTNEPISNIGIKNAPKPQIMRIEKEIQEEAHHTYQVAKLSDTGRFKDWSYYDDFSDIPSDQLKSAIEYIIDQEAPLHKELIYNRILFNTAFNRMGNKIKRKIDSILDVVLRDAIYSVEHDFVYKEGKQIIVRDRVDLHSTEKKFEMIPLKEIELGIIEVVNESISIEGPDLAKEVLNRLGIKTMRSTTKDQFDLELDELVKNGLITKNGIKYISN